MTEDRLLELLAAYGAEPMRWPHAERAAAQAMLAEVDSPRLRAAYAEAEALDGALDGLPAPALTDAARTRVLAGARPGLRQRLRGLLDWQGPLWRPLGAMTAALVLGIGLGLTDTAVETVALPVSPLAADAGSGPGPEDGQGAFLDGGLL